GSNSASDRDRYFSQLSAVFRPSDAGLDCAHLRRIDDRIDLVGILPLCVMMPSPEVPSAHDNFHMIMLLSTFTSVCYEKCPLDRRVRRRPQPRPARWKMMALVLVLHLL